MKVFFGFWGSVFQLFTASVPVQNDLPPRLQWNANGGYCGEVSMIQAGLYYGQYLSQYTVRSVALQGAPQTSGELLLGVNDHYTARQLHLRSEEWDTDQETDTKDFLLWVKQQVLSGHPVSIGVYMNQSIFHPGTGRVGDPDYDHIVTVFQIDTTHPLNDPAYYADDVLYFDDHGLYKERGEPRPYVFKAAFSAFQKSRHEANNPSSSLYSLSNDASNYGLAVFGVMDEDGETVPVRVSTNLNSELPEMEENQETPPPAGPLTVTVAVSELDPAQSYVLYRYDAIEKVPNSGFNKKKDRALRSWEIAGVKEYHIQEDILSNEVAIYRAVKLQNP